MASGEVGRTREVFNDLVVKPIGGNGDSDGGDEEENVADIDFIRFWD